MKRKIYNELIKWKNESQGKTALLIEGARRVGKSYIAEEFAKNNYKSYILIDFSKNPKKIMELFDNYLDNLTDFFLYLQSYVGIELFERESLIIFDEVQKYPRARESIKHLVADGRFDYIETGSLVSIKENVEEILIPSEEHRITMNPLDFEEFCWALGNNKIYELIRKNFEEKKPMGDLMHRKVMNLFRKYLIVGGMPQAVNKYIETDDFKKVDIVKRDILNLYREDIRKHAKRYGLKVERIFDTIASQLSNHEKKFTLASLEKDAKMRDYEYAFMWLYDAKIVNPCFNSNDPSIGLSINEDNSTLKLYMADTGLLLSMAFDEESIVINDIYKKILFDKLEFNGGMIIENIVSQMLISSKHKLYFFSKYSKENASDRMGIDFLIVNHKITPRHNISPIEVKSGKNYTINSLNKFKNKYNEQIGDCYVLHTGDYKEENGIIYLPVYMTSLL